MNSAANVGLGTVPGMAIPKKARIANLFSNVLLICVALALLFVVLEFGARVWLTRFADQPVFRKYASMRQLSQMDTANLERRKAAFFDLLDESLFKYSPHLYMPFAPRSNFRRGRNRHNALGFRGDEIVTPKPDGEFRIVCMGGSTTYTSFVEDYTKSYPARLQVKLHEAGYENVTVVNAGAEGYTTWESLATLQFRVLDLEPDMIIVYHAINDIIARAVEPESYRGDNSGMMVAKTMDTRMLPYYEHSTLIRSLLVRLGSIESHASIASFYTRNPNVFWDFYIQVSQGIYPSGRLEQGYFEQILETNEPRYFRNNLESMVAIAKLRGFVPVLATFAHSPDLRFPQYAELSKYPAAFEAMNQIIREVGDSLDAPVFDFAATFPETPDLYADGVHVNERGAELKAAQFTRFLIEQNLIRSQ